MRYYLFVLLLLPLVSIGQKQDSIKSWRLSSLYGLNGTQSSFVNWNAGGTNNIALTGYVSSFAYYSKKSFSWSNDVSLALGGLLYLGSDTENKLQKTDDRLELSSKVGYKIGVPFYLSFIGAFRTQFIDGFSDQTQTTRNSTFMAPGYLNLALGIDYKPSKNLSIFLSPLSSKFTFVQDYTLSNAGAFGVDPAIYDPVSGLIVTPGSQTRIEFGAFFKMVYNRNFGKNVNLKTKLDLFSNYLDKPQNIDVNADVLFTFKINDWFSTSLNWTLIYDDDVRITDNTGSVGPRTQFKSVLGIGASYALKNFKEEKPKAKKK